MKIVIILLAIFFSLNMGATSFAGSFSTAVGSKAMSKLKAGLLFTILAVLGAVLFGQAVSNTLSKGIIPANLISLKAVAIILAAATSSLFVANLMHIPQSTSLSTLASICGVGLYYHQVAVHKINYLVLCWVLSTISSYFLIYSAARYVYPPRRSNFWVYEKIVHHQERLKKIVVMTSCYKAFAQGSNNVANAVGPLVAAGMVGTIPGLWILGLIFGLGAYTFGGPLKTSSEKIVPLGLLTATIINLVSGTITLVASKLGVPLPTVIVYTVAIFAVSSIKDGTHATLRKSLTKKTFFTWCINPAITLLVSYLLSKAFLK